MNTAKIGTLEAIFFVLIVITNKIILNTPKFIITSCGTSAWINVIYISIIALLFTLLVAKLFKRFEGYNILDISKYLGGNFLKIFSSIGYLILLVLISAVMLRDFSENLKLIYYPNSPLIFIMLFFVIGTVIGNKLGFKAIMKTNLIIMPIVTISILVILFSSLKNMEIERLFPILGNGFDETFISGFSNVFSYSGIAYLFLIMPYLKDSKKFKKISIISIIISSLFLFFSVLCLLLASPYITITEEPMSIYVLTRSLEFGKFFQRTDALFILLFIMSCLSYLTISLFLILDIFKKITNIQDSKTMSYCFSILILGIALIPNNVAQNETLIFSIFKNSILYFVFGFSTIVLILANVKKKKEKNSKSI